MVAIAPHLRTTDKQGKTAMKFQEAQLQECIIPLTNKQNRLKREAYGLEGAATTQWRPTGQSVSCRKDHMQRPPDQEPCHSQRACSGACLVILRKSRPARWRILAGFNGTFMDTTYLLVKSNYRRAGALGGAENMASHFLMPSMSKPCLKLKHPCCQHECLKRPGFL